MQRRSPIVSVRADPATIVLELAPGTPKTTVLAVRPVGNPNWEPLEVERREGQRCTITRYDSARRDRAVCAFAALNAAQVPVGSPRWVTRFTGVAGPPLAWPRSIKGVQCVVDFDDAVALGAKHVGLNCAVREILQPALGGAWGGPLEFIEVDGEKIALNPGALQRYDEQVLRFTQAGINVVVILLNTLGKGAPLDDLIHPATDRERLPNGIGAFNLTTARGARLYRAVLLALSRRYTDPASRYGRVSGFIIGNEVQSHWEWYNIGNIDPATFVADYALALRTAWLTVKSVHPDLRVYVSMDYHWQVAHSTEQRSLPGRQLLDQLTAATRAEGDFDWQIAHHPYPQGLFDPVFWDDNEAGLGYDTPIVTFRNLEVLLAYLAQKEHLGPAGARRVILSEQGFNCNGTDSRSEAIQAAAYAYAYRKVSQMPGIDAFILHRHQDHPQEGGLRLGLRDLQGRRRPIWTVFQKADTPAWESAFAFALPLCGLRSWNEARPFTGRIGEKSGIVRRTTYSGTVIYDFVGRWTDARVENALDWRLTRATNVAGEQVEGLFLHPQATGHADAHYTLTLPRSRRLALRFDTLNTAPQPAPNGLRFAVLLEGNEVWSTVHTDTNRPRAARIDLAPYTGKFLTITFRTQSNGKESYCWATFLSPVVLQEKVK